MYVSTKKKTRQDNNEYSLSYFFIFCPLVQKRLASPLLSVLSFFICICRDCLSHVFLTFFLCLMFLSHFYGLCFALTSLSRFLSQLNLAPWVSLSLFHVFCALLNLLLCLVWSSVLCITLIVICPSPVNRHLPCPPPLNLDHMVVISLEESVWKCSPLKPSWHLYFFVTPLMYGFRFSLALMFLSFYYISHQTELKVFILTFIAKLNGLKLSLSKLWFICVLFNLSLKQNRSITWFIMLFMKHLCNKIDRLLNL